MKINQVLVESAGATVAFAFGRFNPAHQGHIEVWRAVEDAGANWFVGTNPSTLGPNDPLTFEQKSAWMEEIYPPISGHIVPQTTVLSLAAYIFKKLRKNENATVAYVTDATDWAWSGKLLNQYNGVEGSHGYYKFAQIVHVPSPRVSSATALRDAARADDKVAFYHASGTDPKSKVAGLTYFDTVKQAVEKYPLPVKKVKKVKEQGLNELAPSPGFGGSDDDDKYTPADYGKPFKANYLGQNKFEVFCRKPQDPSNVIKLNAEVQKYGLEWEENFGFWFLDSPGAVYLSWKYGEIPLPKAIDQARNPGHIHDLVTDYLTNSPHAAEIQKIAIEYFGFTADGEMSEGIAEDNLKEFAPGNGGGESGRWYTDDQMTDLVGDGWWNDLDISGEVSKQEMIQEAQAWLDDQGYSVHVLNCKVNDDDMEWFIEGSFQNSGFAKKGMAEGQLNELAGYGSDKGYTKLDSYKRYDVYVSKQKFNNLFYIAVAENPRTLTAKFKAKGKNPQEAIQNLYTEVDKEIDVATKVSGRAIIDFNVDFVRDILELSTDTFYAKIIPGPKLVLAGPEMMEYPEIMSSEGYKPSAIRTYKGGEGTTKLPAVPLSTSAAVTANLIANGRYVLGNEEIDKDGNRVFNLEFDSVVQDKNEKMRLRAPALTIGTARVSEVVESEQKTVAKTWDQMTPQEKSSGVKGRTVWNEKTQRYYTVFDVPAKEVDEASLATMRDYFAGDEQARDPYEITKQRLHFSKDKDKKPTVDKRFRSQEEYEQWLIQNHLKHITPIKEDENINVSFDEAFNIINK